MTLATMYIVLGMALGFTIAPREGAGKSLVNIGGSAVISSSGTPVDFKSDEVGGGAKIVTDKASNKVLDIEGSNRNLIFYGRHGGSNQRFVMSGDQSSGYLIKSGDKCLEYANDGKMYRTACTSSAQQKFSIVYTPGDPEYVPPTETPAAGAQEGQPDANRHGPRILIVNSDTSRGDHSHGHRSHGRHSYGHNHHSHYGYLDKLIAE